MRCVKALLMVLAVLLCSLGGLNAAEIKLKDGTVLNGEPVSPTAKGVIIRAPDGTYSQRTDWDKFTNEALQEFAKNPKMRAYVRVVADVEEGNEADIKIPEKAKKPPIEIKVKPSPGRPTDKGTVLGAMLSGFGLVMSLFLYLANLYAAYEVAYFRSWPASVVCTVSAVAPFLGPLIFLSMPTRKRVDRALEAAAAAAAASAEEQAELAAEVVAPVDMPVEEEAAAAAPAVVIPPTQTFRRGEVNINRRFIESKLAGFFRMVPGEAEKDMLLVFKTARGEFIGKRVGKISQTEVTVVLEHAGGSTEESFPLNDIFEIKVRHKDATD